jgi:uncharacterized protein YggE
MRKTIAVLLTFLPAIALGQGAQIESADQAPRIVATATRTTRIAPDRATLYLMIEGSGETPAEASQRAAQKLQSVTSAITGLAATQGAISSLPYGVSPTPALNGYPGSSSQTSYVARYILHVQPTHLDQASAIAAAAIAAGASATSPPFFESSATDSARRVLYTEALLQARHDAEALAAALGGHLGAVVEVSSSGGSNQINSASFLSFLNRYEIAGPMPQPEVVVNATITVRYRFIP